MKQELLRKDILKKATRRDWTEENGVRMGFHLIEKNGLTMRLAGVWGFCYGVLYAIEAVYDTLQKYSDKKIYVLGDLIHNPHVNTELQKRGAVFLDPDEIDRIEPDAVVVVPAFGTRKDIFQKIRDRHFVSVDTTCPEVRTVEEEVTEFSRSGFTAVIHGKVEHQESIATSSFADHYLIIRDTVEAAQVCRFLRGQESRESILHTFARAHSPGFDPDLHLRRIGMANQTTMLMNESLEIFEMFREAISARDGDTRNFHAMKTICSATQDRQDAVGRLARQERMDLFIDVGGHASSNTRNLAITAHKTCGVPVYHIERADCFDRNAITYLPTDQPRPVTQRNWLPAPPVSVGLTAGASTPHSELEEVIQKLLSFF
ncbi:MAG: 4-hydroxy-3-methylbut-2-enyl diphosphate reductase [Candidatus Lindowbacteria bacterium RIFCSPLOWO2_12_FULL_62_27]|nr:MAG: 4-hydroxy-3-methylbut-2-enyl diphosphate reductase [Candidatus Lindowbacteria bacterium RIFCSPLOWO2_12_FULL_62_27]OGH56679.1 MAG: 4-hydroxy-3-methylbut-2-enyl diphosphate reductase [Candidatus Lindowbacteria bacterium RIFCSPLOWO2_02_FULL_62_12]